MIGRLTALASGAGRDGDTRTSRALAPLISCADLTLKSLEAQAVPAGAF